MDNVRRLDRAFCRAIDRAGSMNQLALKTKVSQCSINRYNSGKQNLVNIPFSTMLKLFPNMEVVFQPEEEHLRVVPFDEDIEKIQREAKAIKAEAEALKAEYERKLAALENEKRLFELERENWRLKLENEELKKKKALAMSASAAGEPFTRR